MQLSKSLAALSEHLKHTNQVDDIVRETIRKAADLIEHLDVIMAGGSLISNRHSDFRNACETKAAKEDILRKLSPESFITQYDKPPANILNQARPF